MEVEVRVRDSENNLYSGEFIVVWTDKVTDQIGVGRELCLYSLVYLSFP